MSNPLLAHPSFPNSSHLITQLCLFPIPSPPSFTSFLPLLQPFLPEQVMGGALVDVKHAWLADILTTLFCCHIHGCAKQPNPKLNCAFQIFFIEQVGFQLLFLMTTIKKRPQLLTSLKENISRLGNFLLFASFALAYSKQCMKKMEFVLYGHP